MGASIERFSRFFRRFFQLKQAESASSAEDGSETESLAEVMIAHRCTGDREEDPIMYVSLSRVRSSA